MTDLPIAIDGTLRTPAIVDVVEAVGYGPDSETVTTEINLLADDMHTVSAYASTSKIPVKADGSLAYSAERWIRLRFMPPFGTATHIRFWIPNYNPNPGWQLYWGLATDYQKPLASDPSSIAIYPVPVLEPTTANVSDELLTGNEVQYSPWIVLQAARFPNSLGSLQLEAFNYRFGWAES